MHGVDPLASQIGKGSQVLRPGQPLCLEAAHLAGRCSGPFDRPADHPAHRRIAAQPLGIVHVLVAGKPAEYRLPQQADEQVTTVLAGAHIREHVYLMDADVEKLMEFLRRKQD